MTVNELAVRLEVVPTTVSLMVGELTRKGILERREDEADRRRRIVGIAEGAADGQRKVFVDTLRAYEAAMAGDEA